MNTQSSPQGPPPLAPPEAAPTTSRSRRWPRSTTSIALVTGVAGLCLGIAISSAYSLWNSDDSVNADSDFDVLCHYAADVLEVSSKDRFDNEKPYFWRAHTLSRLINAATIEDSSLNGLSDTGKDLDRALGLFKPDQLQQSLEQMDAFCDENR